MKNRTMIQMFEWYLPADGMFWRDVCEKAESLASVGITEVWLPPAYKGAAGINDVGYGVYDMYDLGEFDQKGSVSTKYGTKNDYINVISALKTHGISVYADVVFNHRMGADATELVFAKEYRQDNRKHFIVEGMVEAWTVFNFKGRNGIYSDFKWNHTNFDGCDWDQRNQRKGVYLFEGKSWDTHVDIEMGNYDYLMGADLDFENEETFCELINWGKWYLDFTDIDGFRIDAVKHVNFEKIAEWVKAMREHSGKELYAVGEYWNQHLSALTYYLDKTAHTLTLFDVPLHYNFYNASRSNGHYGMGAILNNTLVSERPQRAVTIVDNHDTQPGQALESWVAEWFKLHAYSIILLRAEGLPCVFYGDVYGIQQSNIKPIKRLPTLIKVRRDLAYGEQIDYFDNSSIVGFSRLGMDEHDLSGLAVVMTDSVGGVLRICLGERFIGKTVVDILENVDAKITVEQDGCANLPVKDGSVSVYVDEAYLMKFHESN